MFALVLGLVIGIFIGWNWAQPPWARTLQLRLINMLSSSSNRIDH